MEQKYLGFDYIRNEIIEEDKKSIDIKTRLGNIYMENQTGDFYIYPPKKPYGGTESIGEIEVLKGDINAAAIHMNTLDIEPWAQAQLFEKMGMPPAYFSRLKEEGRQDLVYGHFAKWRAESPNMPLMIRMKNEPAGLKVRAVLSDKYSRLDNIEFIDALGRAITETSGDGAPGFRVADYYNDGTRMHIRIVNLDDGGIEDPRVGDPIQTGFDGENSEVGFSSARLSPVAYRLVCTNGLKRWEASGKKYEQRHIGLQNEIFLKNFTQAITAVIDESKQLLEDYRKTTTIIIPAPLLVIARLAQEHKRLITKAIEQTATVEWENETDYTAYGVINAFTAAAKSLTNENRLELEKFGGYLTSHLGEGDWQRLSEQESL